VPGSSWHFTCCCSRDSPTYYCKRVRGCVQPGDAIRTTDVRHVPPDAVPSARAGFAAAAGGADRAAAVLACIFTVRGSPTLLHQLSKWKPCCSSRQLDDSPVLTNKTRVYTVSTAAANGVGSTERPAPSRVERPHEANDALVAAEHAVPLRWPAHDAFVMTAGVCGVRVCMTSKRDPPPCGVSLRRTVEGSIGSKSAK
jgi:hypothetical protein